MDFSQGSTIDFSFGSANEAGNGDAASNADSNNGAGNANGASLGGAAGKASRTINIQDIYDPHARYQMPDIEFRVKHQGQYNQTHITNLPCLAIALKVPLDCLVKFYGIQLSTQAKFNKKTGEFSMKGPFTYEELMAVLRIFIDKYVLCTKCNLPELKHEMQKNRLKITCQACGKVAQGDMNDRIYKCFK